MQKPVLPDRPQHLMEPIRLDAQHGYAFEIYGSPGDEVYAKWRREDRDSYDEIPDTVKLLCFKQWVAYYTAHPEESLAHTGDEVPF